MSLNEKLLQLIADYKDESIQLRHHLHDNPELSGQEFETSKFF